MTTTAAYDADSARTSALDALRAWARTRDRLPVDRARLLALAWHTGNRNIQELARLTDVSRDTVYADLRAHDINPKDRDAAITAPRYEALRADTVAAIADLAATRFKPAMLHDAPDPLAAAAWHATIALTRIAELLADSEGTVLADSEGTALGERVLSLDDLAARGGWIAEAAWQAFAAGNSVADLVAYTDREAELSLDLSEPVVDAAWLRVSLPNEHAITVELRQDAGQPFTVHSDSPHLTGQLDGPAHLAISAALAAIAEAIKPTLSHQAMGYDNAEPHA